MRPEYVPVIPDAGAAVDDCFRNVRARVDRDGGEILHGWQIWEWVGVLVEAEFHAVWVSPVGQKIDVTPKSENRILFLPDAQLQWTGRHRDNIRLPVTPSQLFDDLQAVSKRIVSEYNLAPHVPEGPILPLSRIGPLMELKGAISTLLNAGGNLNSPCPCGSQRKYKICHRRILFTDVGNLT